jgi:hypothetical protein
MQAHGKPGAPRRQSSRRPLEVAVARWMDLKPSCLNCGKSFLVLVGGRPLEVEGRQAQEKETIVSLSVLHAKITTDANPVPNNHQACTNV